MCGEHITFVGECAAEDENLVDGALVGGFNVGHAGYMRGYSLALLVRVDCQFGCQVEQGEQPQDDVNLGGVGSVPVLEVRQPLA